MRKTFLALVPALAVVLGSAPGMTQTDPAPARVSLTQAVSLAIARNPSIASSLADLQRAEALVREVRASSLPTVTGNGTYTRLDADRVFQGRGVILGRDQLGANVTLNVPLLAPSRWVQWSHAKDNVEVSRMSTSDARRLIAVTSARAYLTVIQQNRLVEVNALALKSAKDHFDYAHTRLSGGVGNRIDDIRAAQVVATTQAQLETTTAGLARAREALGLVIGENKPIDADPDVQLGAVPPLATALDDARVKRTDINVAQARVRAAEKVRNDNWADYMPLLSGTFQPFYQTPPSLTQPTTGWQAQLILSVPFYDGGMRYGQADERRALEAGARAQLDTALRQASSDVRTWFETMRRADQALVSAQQAAKLAKEALDLANLAYRAGATTNIEVLDAERRSLDAETAAVMAEDAARQARLELLAASGRFP
jgi:outer membrane protein TolC